MKALRILCLVLALGVLGAVAWRTVHDRPIVSASPPTDPARTARLKAAMQVAAGVAAPPPVPTLPSSDGRMAEVPEFAGFYRRLRSEFPRDYSAFVDSVGRPGGSRDADAAIWEALRDLRQGQGILVADAAPGALDRFFDARSAMLESLAPLNARQCVDFLYGLTDASLGDFTQSHHSLVATLADRTMDAMVDGRTHHDARAAPTEGDLDALTSGLSARGLSQAEIALLLDGEMPDPPPADARLCQIGRLYLDALRALPAEPRERIYGLAAELLARS